MSWPLHEELKEIAENLIQSSQLLDQYLNLSNTSLEYYYYSNPFDGAVFRRVNNVNKNQYFWTECYISIIPVVFACNSMRMAQTWEISICYLNLQDRNLPVNSKMLVLLY
jgi:hypothetical protein